jgi:hypothetical protein
VRRPGISTATALTPAVSTPAVLTLAAFQPNFDEFRPKTAPRYTLFSWTFITIPNRSSPKT